jgi:hypothetical protein
MMEAEWGWGQSASRKAEMEESEEKDELMVWKYLLGEWNSGEKNWETCPGTDSLSGEQERLLTKTSKQVMKQCGGPEHSLPHAGDTQPLFFPSAP